MEGSSPRKSYTGTEYNMSWPLKSIPPVSKGSDRMTLVVLPGLRFCETMGCNGQFHNSLFLEGYYLSWSISKLRHEKTEQTTHIFRVEIHEKNTDISESVFPSHHI